MPRGLQLGTYACTQKGGVAQIRINKSKTVPAGSLSACRQGPLAYRPTGGPFGGLLQQPSRFPAKPCPGCRRRAVASAGMVGKLKFSRVPIDCNDYFAFQYEDLHGSMHGLVHDGAAASGTASGSYPAFAAWSRGGLSRSIDNM